MDKPITTVLWLMLTTFVTAQYHDRLMFGIKAGVDYNQLSNITNTIVNDENRPQYQFFEKNRYLPAVSFFTLFRFPNSQVGIDSRISYYQAAADIDKQSIMRSTIENYDICYHYLAVGLYPKVYLYKGLNLGAGVNIGACLNPSSGITYQSSTGSVARNMQTQQHISQALKGRTNITAALLMGYEFKFGLSIEGACYFGLTDVIETMVNPYNFIESRNNTRSIQFTIGWAISKEGFYF